VARDTQEGIASALVTVRSVRSLEDLAQGVTDPEGGFSIGGLPAGTYEVVARKGTLAGSYERPLVLAPPGEQRIVLAIDQGATIEGRVRTARGASVGSARLALGRWDFETRRGDPAGAADASGRFTIRGVLPEHTAVIALVGEQVSGSRRIHVQPGDHISGVEIVVPETGELLALVLAEGQPASAEVSVWSARGGAGWQAMARTGSDGQARFATIPAGKVVVEATDAEGRRAETLTEVGDGSRSLARLVLEPVEKVTVQGGVSWMDGRPATGITVFIYCRGLEWEHQRSDDRGAYRFEGCEAGPFDVRAFRSDAGLDDWQRAHSPGNHPPLAPGERIRTVNLTVPSGGKRVAGQVFTPEGQPASAAQVTVGGGLEERSDSTDEGGRFEFLDLARQRHSVRVRAAGHPEAHVVTTEADATALVFRLRPGARLSGTVRGPEGKPRPYARVIASSAAGGGETYSSGNGTFILTGLGAGAHEVSVRGDDGRDHPVANVILEAGADKHLDLTVKDGVDLRN
jgi:hypothetical protein